MAYKIQKLGGQYNVANHRLLSSCKSILGAQNVIAVYVFLRNSFVVLGKYDCFVHITFIQLMLDYAMNTNLF